MSPTDPRSDRLPVLGEHLGDPLLVTVLDGHEELGDDVGELGDLAVQLAVGLELPLEALHAAAEAAVEHARRAHAVAHLACDVLGLLALGARHQTLSFSWADVPALSARGPVGQVTSIRATAGSGLSNMSTPGATSRCSTRPPARSISSVSSAGSTRRTSPAGSGARAPGCGTANSSHIDWPPRSTEAPRRKRFSRAALSRQPTSWRA